MKFHITLNDEDYLAFNICHYLGNPANKPAFFKKLINSTLISLGVVFLILFLLFLFMGLDKSRFVIYMSILMVFEIGMIIYFFVSYPRIVRKNTKEYVKNLKKQGKLPYDSEINVEFFEEEMIATNDSGVRREKYSDITRISQDEEHIYIMIGAARGIPLPLRCLEGRENELLEFLNGKLQKHVPQTDTQS